MNILFLVLTLLLLITTMTYARMSSYVTFASIRTEYERFMKVEERKWMNVREMKNYENNKKLNKSTTKKERELKSIARLNVAPLVSKEAQNDPEKGDQAYESARYILTRLIELLYGEIPFYKEQAERYANLPDLIVDQIVEESHSPTCGGEFKSVKDLARVSFEDKGVRELYYKMLNKENSNFTGYPSLLSFLTYKKSGSFAIGMFLAKPPLLQAIFRTEDTAQNFIERRAEIWRQVSSKVLTPDVGAAELKNQFGDLSQVEARFLDFTPSKSRPPKS